MKKILLALLCMFTVASMASCATMFYPVEDTNTESNTEQSNEEENPDDEEEEEDDHEHKGVKVKSSKATCTEEGNIEYWTCECGKVFSDKKCKDEIDLDDTILEKTAHDLKKTKAQAATCQKEGNIAYWTCNDCKKIFSDEDGEEEIELKDTVLTTSAHAGVKTEAKAASCTAEGNIVYWTCECGKLFSDKACENEITLADTVLKKRAHVGVKVEAKAASCEADGNIEYFECSCGALFEDKACTKEITLADTVVEKLAHVGVKTEAKAASCEAEGNIEYWTCECGKLFSDEACENEITLADTVLGATDHDYGDDGVCACGKDIADKSALLRAGEGCAEVTYTDGLGWKATAAGEANYYLKINRKTTAYYMSQGYESMTITFSGAFDGADYGVDSTLKCYIWIMPPKATDGGNDWNYTVSRKMQVELDKNADGTYSHTIDLTNAAYDFENYDLTLYVDYKAANTGNVVGAIYIKDIAYSMPANLEDRNLWISAGENCASVVYTEGSGWKATAASEKNYYLKINHEVTASQIAQGNKYLRITFCGAFDGADYGTDSTLKCRIWIMPPKAGSGGNDWNYPVSQMMQVELDKNSDGTYSHTIDLTNAAYDFVNYDLTLYVDYKAANTGNVVGAIYIKDIAYLETDVPVTPDIPDQPGTPDEPEVLDKSLWVTGSDGCADITYTENKGWKVSATDEASNYYIKINHEVTASYMEQGKTQMTITFSGAFDGTDYGSDSPLKCCIWILPPRANDGGNDWTYPVSQMMQTQLTKNADGTYSHTIDLTSAGHDFTKYNLTIYVAAKTADTGARIGAIYIKDIAYTAAGEVAAPEKANYLYGADGECDVVYTDNGWKVFSLSTEADTSNVHYNFYLKKEVIQYYVQEGATKLTIMVGGSFDGTVHGGNAVNCQEWIIPKTATGSDDWTYKNGFFSFWENLGDGKYSFTIDLTDVNYNFVDYDLRIRVSYNDKGTSGLSDASVGATYIYDLAFTA